MSIRTPHAVLTKRERQIMDALYKLGRAHANDILARMPGAPSYSTIRTQLRVLEEKGHVRHEEDGHRFVYIPIVSRHAARRTAVKHLIDTFFDGSPANLLTTLLGRDGTRLTEEELERIKALITASKDGVK